MTEEVSEAPGTGPDPSTAPIESPAPVDPGHAVARRPATSLLTWATVALVLVIVIVLVVIKVTGTSPASTPTVGPSPAPAPAAVVQAVTHIPASVYGAVGVTSSVAAVMAPTLLHGQPPLVRGGKTEVVYVGDEFCPFCAAERWALVAALSRFGKFSVLDTTQSGSNESFPSTPTFTFDGTRYSSKYIATTLVEHYGDQKNGAGTAYAVLERLPSAVRALVAKYDKSTPGAPGGLVPFVDIGNDAVVAGGSFSPSVLQQLSDTQIASALHDPKDPATQAIVASANYLTAVICHADGEQPATVCTSKGAATAASTLGLSA